MLRKWTSYLTEKLDTRFKRIGLLAFGPSFLTLLILAIAWNVQTLSRGVIYYKEFPFIYPNIIYHPRYDQKPLADGEDQYVIGPIKWSWLPAGERLYAGFKRGYYGEWWTLSKACMDSKNIFYKEMADWVEPEILFDCGSMAPVPVDSEFRNLTFRGINQFARQYPWVSYLTVLCLIGLLLMLGLGEKLYHLASRLFRWIWGK